MAAPSIDRHRRLDCVGSVEKQPQWSMCSGLYGRQQEHGLNMG